MLGSVPPRVALVESPLQFAVLCIRLCRANTPGTTRHPARVGQVLSTNRVGLPDTLWWGLRPRTGWPSAWTHTADHGQRPLQRIAISRTAR